MSRTFWIARGVIILLPLAILGTVLSGSAQWTQHSPTGAPPSVRTGAAGAFDPARGRLIVFGGDNNCNPRNDLWVLTGASTTGQTSSWQQLTPAGTPPAARYGHAAAYDEVNDRLIVFGGFAGSACTFSVSSRNDVWILDHASGITGVPTWTQLNPSGTPPAPRVRSSVAYDPNSNRLIVFGGNPSEGNCFQGLSDTWVLTNANGLGGVPAWTQLATGSPSPSPRSAHSAGYDPANNRLIVFGGGLTCQSGTNNVWILRNANGLGGAPTWQELNVPGTLPPIRAVQGGVYDTTRNQFTIYGGGNTANLGDVWRLDAANGLGTPSWTMLWETSSPFATPSSPPGPGDPSWRNGHVMALDTASGALVVFGGMGWNSRMNDAWVFSAGGSDTEAPVTSAQINPAPSGGWNRMPATVHLTATDNVAVASMTYSLSGAMGGGGTVTGSSATVNVTPDGTTVVTYYATDSSGNVAASKSVTVRIDTLAPLVAHSDIETPATSSSGAVVTFAPTASDANGIASLTVTPPSGSLFPIGRTNVTVTASDPAGNVASATFNVTVQRLPQSIDFPGLFAAAGTFGSPGSGDGQFLYPNGAAFDAAGNLVVADTNNNRIQKFAPDGTWQWSAGGFNRPQDVAVDGNGNIYLADYNASLIHKLGPDGARLAAWTGLHLPTGIEVGPDGNVYVAGWGTGRVYVFSPQGVLLRDWPSPGAYMLTSDRLGDLYVTDNGGSRVRKFGADGTPKGVWGGPGSSPGQFLSPGGIAADAAGHVYVLDGGNGRVQQFTSTGLFVAQFGAASVAAINVTKDASGRLWVSDYSGHRLRIFEPYLPNRTYGDPDFTVAAGSTSGLAVVFWADGTCTVSGDVVHLTGAGSCTVTASQQGDAIYAAAAPISRTFTIAAPLDTAPPVLTLPSDGPFEATGPSGTEIAFTATAFDAVDGPVAAICNPGSPAIFGIGTTPVTCTATDAAGNTATETFNVTVQDTTAPTLALPDNIAASATGATTTVNYEATATDAVSPSPMTSCTPAPNSHFPVGTTTVNCSATDSAGNTRTGSFTITIVDDVAPVLTLPSPIAAEATGPAGAPVSFAASAVDAVNGARPVACTPASGSTFALGTTTVNCSASDSAGNTASDSFTVTVADTTAPALTLPGNIVAEATSFNGATVTFTATATDAVHGWMTAMCLPMQGNVFPLGATTVNCSATDGYGNTASGAFTVIVQDTTAPALTLPSGVTVPATGPTTIVNYEATATDAASPSPPVVTCTPAPNSHFAVGSTTVNCSASDSAGNTSSGSFTISVVDSTPPSLTLPAPISREATGPSGAVVTFDAAAVDAVNGPRPVSCTPSSGSTFAIGTTTVSCTASDAFGNAATDTFTVVVSDTTAPMLTLPGNIVAEATSPNGAQVTFAATSTDVVFGSTTPMCTPLSGTVFPLGVTTVTCTAIDGHGNSATGTFTVTVHDTTPPVLALPANIVVPATGPTTIVNYQASATDAATASPMISCTPAPNSHFAIGPTAVNCWSSDAAGNLSSGSFTITVVDTTPPVLACPAATSAAGNTSGHAPIPDFTSQAVASDYMAFTIVQSLAAGTAAGLGTTTVTLTATDMAGNSSSCQTTFTVSVGGETVSGSVGPNGSITTDVELDGATTADPIEVTVTTAIAGNVTITEEPVTSAPGEFTLLGHVVQITAPADTVNLQPARAVFRLDVSLLPPGTTADTIEVFRNGAIVPQCPGGSLNQPTCITMRMTREDGDIEIEVRTVSFSQWTFGMWTSPMTPARIAEAVQSLPLNSGQKNSLTVKLNRRQLGAFINEVEALRRSGRLDAATADGLIARAQSVMRQP